MTNTQNNGNETNKTPGQTQSPAPAQQTQGGGATHNQPKPAEKPQQK
ncbi:hypothetical protein [Pseudolabrys sp. FHR47]|nr:hypothetical protein [Pseudolabrys sp. FHR47]